MNGKGKLWLWSVKGPKRVNEGILWQENFLVC